jgi:hypothetical protein
MEHEERERGAPGQPTQGSAVAHGGQPLGHQAAGARWPILGTRFLLENTSAPNVS